MTLVRNIRIVLQMLKTSVEAQAQYRVDFIVQLLLSVFWSVWHVAPLWIVFELRSSIAGWTRPEAMLVMSAFLMLKALLEGLIMPNVGVFVEAIRSGSFDFVLLKPVDAQLMVSFQKVLPARLVNFLAGVGLGIWSIAALEPGPTLGQLGAGFSMLIAGTLAIYALWLAVICSAFWWVKVDNLSFLFTSVFDAARWPISIFRGWVRFVLTFVLPVALMTSYPALAILGKLTCSDGLIAWLLAAVLLIVSRFIWIRAVAHYSSASS